jgi:hypothetical protein
MSQFLLGTFRRPKVPIQDEQFSLPNFGFDTFGFSPRRNPKAESFLFDEC